MLLSQLERPVVALRPQFFVVRSLPRLPIPWDRLHRGRVPVNDGLAVDGGFSAWRRLCVLCESL